MNDTTIISYSRSKSDDLMCLAEGRSRYMLPFGGRFRVVDFTIQNAVSSGAGKTIIYNDYEDYLHDYVSRYGAFENAGSPPPQVISTEFSDIKFCYNLIKDCNTAFYAIYNGDNPSIINFSKIVEQFKKNKTKAVLYKLKIGDTASMANTVLVTERKYLLSLIDSARKKEQTSPNIFEMIINSMINKGIKKSVADAFYWSMKTVPDYFNLNMQILKDQKLASLIYHESSIRSHIVIKGMADLGRNARVANSIVSDNCKISGTVMNSIIFPGVEIGENTIITDSIILPNIRIGSGVRITRTIIDEGNASGQDETNGNFSSLNIGNNCKIGVSDDTQMKNSDFPNLNNSITLIGKKCFIPDNARIGGACYIASGKGQSYFEKSIHLYNSMSIVN